jgi:hypothetical protein
MSNSVVDDLLLRLIRQEQVSKLQDITKDRPSNGNGVQKLFSELRYESLFIYESYSTAEQDIILSKVNLLKTRIMKSAAALDDDNSQLLSLIEEKIRNGYRLTKDLMVYLNKLYLHFKTPI